MRYFAFGAWALFLLSLTAMLRGVEAAEPLEPGHGLCRDIAETVNAIADFTDTLCLSSRDPEGMSLVLISSQPVFAVEAAKRAWLITSIGLTIGVGLAWGLNFLLANVADGPAITWSLVAGGVVAFWLVGLAAALMPALRGATVEPAVATRSV